MKLSKADAKTLVELLIKAGKDVGYSVRAKHISASDTDWDIIFFDIQHLDDKDFDEVCKYIDEFNSSDINSALSDLNSALKDGIEALENYDKNKKRMSECPYIVGNECDIDRHMAFFDKAELLDKVAEKLKARHYYMETEEGWGGYTVTDKDIDEVIAEMKAGVKE